MTTAPKALTNYISFNAAFSGLLAFIIIMAGAWGCAPLPPMETQTQVVMQKGPTLSKTQRDSIIMVNRSFAHENWKNNENKRAIQQLNVVRYNDLEHEVNIYRVWADCFNREGMNDSALFAYQEGIKYFPEDDYLHSSLAIMYRNSGSYDEAVTHMELASKLMPDNMDYMQTLEDLYETVGNTDAAIETLKKMVAINPDDATLNDRLIKLIRSTRSPEEYLAGLAEQVLKFPDDAAKRYDYAQALLEMGENESAVEQFGKYIKLQPSDVRGHKGLTAALQNLGIWNKALKALEKLHELDPASKTTMLEIGEVYLELGNYVKARQWAKQAIAIESNYGPAWLLLGDVFYKSADKASGSTPKYNDKLVFAIAYGLYKKATETGDPMVKGDAERAQNSLKNGGLIPVKTERFMNQKKMRPTGEVYGWINSDWPEVRYLDSYLKALD